MSDVQITRVESAIVQRLTTVLTKPDQAHPMVEVRSWPARPQEWRMTHPLGAVLVIYKGATWPKGKQRGLVSWPAEFELGVFARNLATHQPAADSPDAGTGAYDLLAVCRAAVGGWQPADAADPITLVREQYEGHRDGVWGYALRIAVPLMSVMGECCAGGPAFVQGGMHHPQDFFPPLE